MKEQTERPVQSTRLTEAFGASNTCGGNEEMQAPLGAAGVVLRSSPLGATRVRTVILARQVPDRDAENRVGCELFVLRMIFIQPHNGDSAKRSLVRRILRD